VAVRKIIRIDESKCDGCGDCVSSCAEGAIAIINGKAKLVSETYCDGLGACLKECPQGAITMEERDAAGFSDAAVASHLARQVLTKPAVTTAASGCPGSAMRQFQPPSPAAVSSGGEGVSSQLSHWPVQLKLVAPGAPFLKGADILICADCVPFVVPDFHSKFLAGKVVLVGCPKLDDLNFYFEKLKQIFLENQPRSITVVKMEVPCCNGIVQATVQACNEVVPQAPLESITIGLRGDILSRQQSRMTA